MTYLVKVSDESASRKGHYMGKSVLLTGQRQNARLYDSIADAAADIGQWIDGWRDDIGASVTFDVVVDQPAPVVTTITKAES